MKGEAAAESVPGFDPAQASAQELAQRELCRRRLLPFTQRFVPKYKAGWFHKDLAKQLEEFSAAVIAQQDPRLMVFVPPRHGKSEITSRRFPAWHLGHAPHHEFISCSYSAPLAMSFSRVVRTTLREPGYHQLFDTRLDAESQSVESWLTNEGGGYLAAGVGGPITGHGAHILLIDDPIKNRAEAESASNRQAIYDWYTSTAYTRLAPGGGVVLIMTRWHDDDLAGRLLDDAKNGGDQWKVINYPAEAEEDEPYRKKGEALHPQRYNRKRLQAIKKAIGPRDWNALYQQKPVPDSGDYFQDGMFRFYRPEDLPPQGAMNYYSTWDLSVAMKQKNDYSVGGTAGIDRQGRLWLVDLYRDRPGPERLVEEILDMQQRWAAGIVGLEDGQIRMALGPLLEQRIRARKQFNFVMQVLKPGRADKGARARTIQGLMQRGMVLFPDPATQPWVSDLIAELKRFPFGTFDDQVDMLAWLGILVNEFIAVRPPTEAKQKSWRDRLSSLMRGPERSTSAMAA